MRISEVQKRAWRTAEEKGWHEPREIEGVVRQASTGERLGLINSEVAEGLEEVRKGKEYYDLYFVAPVITEIPPPGTPLPPSKPEGLIVELADVVIRAAELAEGLGLDLEEAVLIKMAYNSTRPTRHGGKVL